MISPEALENYISQLSFDERARFLEEASERVNELWREAMLDAYVEQARKGLR